MKRILFLLATFLIAGNGSIQAQVAGIGPGPNPVSTPLLWDRFTVKGEEFSVNLPTVPAMTTTRGIRKNDQKPQLQRHLQTSYDDVVYSIDVFENPKPRQSLEEFIAEQTANSDYDPAAAQNLTIYGVPGRRYLSAPNSSPAIAQFFATEKRLYRFVASGPNVARRATTDFFLSIKLGKNTEGFEVYDGAGIPLTPDTEERIYKGSEVDVKAKMLSMPPPNQSKVEEGTTGIVVLKVVFAKTGRVEKIRVVAGLPGGATESAIESARQIRFTPAMKDGKPVSMWMQLEYKFMRM